MPPQYQKLTPKPAMVKAESSQDARSKAHRRSRTGCFTCRLRRKKCDESKPCCKACKKLGVDCEYSLPNWWTNPDRRRKHRDNIKNIIKLTKLSERQPAIPKVIPSSMSPPSLCHSLASSESHYGSFGSSRAQSLDSCYSSHYGMNVLTHSQDFHPHMIPHFHWAPPFPHFPAVTPLEVDVRTDREVFIDEVPLLKDQITGAYSELRYQPDVVDPLMLHHGILEQNNEFFLPEPTQMSIFKFAYDPITPTHQAIIDIEDCDKHLLDHFLNHVVKLIFPMLEISQPGSPWADVILPALESNRSYLHGCLSVAALHIKAIHHNETDEINDDIMRHRIAAVSELCESFGSDTDISKILEATLAMIFFQSALGSSQDGLPDISWHQHFQTATDYIQTLQLQHIDAVDVPATPQPSFQMTLASWIDILRGTMIGKSPDFAQLYREKRELNIASGFAELMGCDDNVMYLISEISCLEGLRDQGYGDDVEIMCAHITDIGKLLDYTEIGYGDVLSVYDAVTGAIKADQLACNMTAIFRMAARLYLCSLVPEFEYQHVVTLLDSFVNAMALVPAGPDGFDRSLVWPLLMAGSLSIEGSSFRHMFVERIALMGDGVEFGAFGRLTEILEEVWAINDAATTAIAAGDVDAKIVHWRDAMKHKGWDFLLI